METRRGGGSSAVHILQRWLDGANVEVLALVEALASGGPAVDALLDQRGPELARPLLGDQLYDFEAALEEGPRLPSARLLAIAAGDPEAFLWSMEPGRLLPLDSEADAARFAELFTALLAEGDEGVALRWLRSEGCLPGEQAVPLLEARLRAVEAEGGWRQITRFLSALAVRGAPWQAARRLERSLAAMWLDPREAHTIQRVALRFVDPPLLRCLAEFAPWLHNRSMLHALIERCGSAELIRAFPADGAAERSPRRRLQGIVWDALAGREGPDVPMHCARLIAELGRGGGSSTEADSLSSSLIQRRGAEALAALVVAFLAGLQRSSVGDELERWFSVQPEATLIAALAPLPDWAPGFDPQALERLCLRLLPSLDAAAKARVTEAAKSCGQRRGALVREELRALS